MLNLFPIPEQECNDKNCPYHGKLRVHGRILEGVVVSSKMQKTVVVKIDYIWRDKKYKRYEKRSSKIKAHNPPCLDAKEGDLVKIMETRPIAKTVKFVVVQVLKRAEE
ncbi:MAG: 30S ribosomal protein S17 [Candidatus Njordarchaeia archaeon]|nr:30S ribosomal protein S17 [Candidatus Korarchaeota archaeon]